MISFLLVLLFVLVMAHCIYETAVAPSLRLRFRYRFFELRDRLRRYAQEQPCPLREGGLVVLEESLNVALGHASKIDLLLCRRARRKFRGDKSFRLIVEHRRNLLDAIEDDDFVAIRRDFYESMRGLMMVNMGGWCIYVLPVIFCFVIWKRLCSRLKYVAVIPEAEFESSTPLSALPA